MIHRNYLGTLAILCAVALPSNASDLYVKVTDAKEVALAGVSITVEKDGVLAVGPVVTGEDGTFTIRGLASGVYIAVARKAGFADLKSAPIEMSYRVESRTIYFRLLPNRQSGGGLRRQGRQDVGEHE